MWNGKTIESQYCDKKCQWKITLLKPREQRKK